MINLDSNWQAHIQHGVGSFNTSIYLLNVDKEKVRIARLNNNGDWEISDLREGEMDVIPSLVFPMHLWNAIKNEIFKQPSPKQEVVDAELTATKYHLEDMRKIVFNEPIETISVDINKASKE